MARPRRSTLFPYTTLFRSAEIYHLKQSGRDNWGKIGAAIARVEAARARGLRITADMYTYPASSTGFDAAMPDRKSTRLNSSHGYTSYAVFCLKKKKHRTLA